ncbi:MAG: nucleoside phosphorylase [Bacteroidetes bacterium]|nr:nucleoside phosphorylase [Bacteroidota bacterium]MCL1968873.1 nucleoside phosphorylase [Bacteroidota bacterium]
MKIPPSELPLQPTGAIYHLGIHPENLSDKIILVGDPGRVAKISEKFDTVEFTNSHRELTTHTGYYKNKRISVISTGMGTDNIDIVMTELDALANVDLRKMEVKPEHKTLTLVRVGTCGAIQKDIPVGSFIAAQYGFGFDGLLQFYKHNSQEYEDFVKHFVEFSGWGERLPYPYCYPADKMLLENIAFDMVHGITASAPGFFGPQGRYVHAPLAFPNMNEKIEDFVYQEKRITNLEMECSAIYGLGNILGHRTLTVCLAIANRVTHHFLNDYNKEMEELITKVLDRI